MSEDGDIEDDLSDINKMIKQKLEAQQIKAEWFFLYVLKYIKVYNCYIRPNPDNKASQLSVFVQHNFFLKSLLNYSQFPSQRS